jgi:putative transferase (TIGR04331 family)
MSRFLITTADERTWPKDQPVLFLGEWCRLHHRKESWENLDAQIVPYHWDDRGKLHHDFLYLRELHEQLLLELSQELNAQHGVDHSLRYWRILVGPWLGYFVQMLFDRWEMIQRAIAEYGIAGVQVMDIPMEQMVPNDMHHFDALYTGDTWNEVIYSQLLDILANVPVKRVHALEPCSSTTTHPSLSFTRRMKHSLARVASLICQRFTRDDEAFFLATYLPTMQCLRLECRLGQVPKLWRSVQSPKVALNWSRRQWQLGRSGQEGFPAVARAMIPKHIPTLYMEGYAALTKHCDRLPWPKKPRLVFTSNSYSSDDVFKAWAAEKVEAGTALVIGQHGGNYGVGRWGFSEDHECAISDGWLSWGWDDESRPQIKPVGNLKMVGVDMGWDPEGDALMVEVTMPRYSYHMYSVPVAGQWLGYFDEQCRFVDALPDDIRRSLLVRLYGIDYGWNQSARWRERFPDIRLDEGRAPIAPLISKSRLYVSTYNATTFLESMAMNIPTIIFWNVHQWEIRDSAVPFFERLKSAGIFHETPELAAHQMTKVWHNVANWWNSNPVQGARREFCSRYSHIPQNPLENLEGVLRRIAPAAME